MVICACLVAAAWTAVSAIAPPPAAGTLVTGFVAEWGFKQPICGRQLCKTRIDPALRHSDSWNGRSKYRQSRSSVNNSSNDILGGNRLLLFGDDEHDEISHATKVSDNGGIKQTSHPRKKGIAPVGDDSPKVALSTEVRAEGRSQTRQNSDWNDAAEKRSERVDELTVVYSKGLRQNISAVDPGHAATKHKTTGAHDTAKQADAGDVPEPAQQENARKHGNSHKEVLYSQLLRLFETVSPAMQKENTDLYTELHSLVKDLDWNAWEAAAASPDGIKDFYSLQLGRYKSVDSGFRQCLSAHMSRWKECLNTTPPMVSNALSKLTKPLGMQHALDVGEFLLLIDELVDRYHKNESEHRWKVLYALKDWMVNTAVAAVDVVLPLRPAERLVGALSFAKSVCKWIASKLMRQDGLNFSFNEFGLFKYYEMTKSYIHVPDSDTWPQDCQPLAPPGGGAWKLTFLGTGSRKTSKTRVTSSILFARSGMDHLWLFDCGEASILRLYASGYSDKRVKKIFLTHLHGDHSFGLFSFLSAAPSSTPIEVYGPSGTAQFIANVLSATSKSQKLRSFVVNELVTPGHETDAQNEREQLEKTFKINYIYPDGNMHYIAHEDDTCVVKAAPLVHTINTVGYVVQEKLAEELDSPMGLLEPTLVGTSCVNDKGSDASGNMNNAKRPPRKFAICQDTADSRLLQPLAMDADVLIHESTINAPSNAGSEMLLRLTRHVSSDTMKRTTMRMLDQLLQTEEMKFQMCHSTLSNIQYYYNRKLRALRDVIQHQETLADAVGRLDEAPADTFPSQTAAIGTKSNTRNGHEVQERRTPTWTTMVRQLIGELKLYSEAQFAGMIVNDMARLVALINELSDISPGDKGQPKSRVMQTNMRALAVQLLEEQGVQVDRNIEFTGEADSSKASRSIDRITPLIFQYWSDVMGVRLPVLEHDKYGRLEWEKLYNAYARFNGHSTCLQAGEFASRIRARKLILTHFSQNCPDGQESEHILTMTRIAHAALRGYRRHHAEKEGRKLIVGTAWDTFSLTI
ncbi:Pb-reticulocyte binding protein, putative [Babesia ovata]|uniref:Pb-reticulocyte binding protein, putative n=1 Tax=Babesia ovata TaxID=189622 RepID=A0A2H6KGL2_9APIC|nr:Pb-reticulocyte binding protein, putative [Babesia ovata]GBE62124.1 Pb-reticulocyte binding protein, putative [Babesia ovata]